MKVKELLDESTDIFDHEHAKQNKRKQYKKWQSTKPNSPDPSLPKQREISDHERFRDVYDYLKRKGIIYAR